jgi:Zn-finger nucleic acid-binding protein
MLCSACGANLEVHVFPGGHVRCACGADNVVPALDETPVHDPYRQPAAAPEPPPAAATAHSHDLGPLCPRCIRLLHDDEKQAALACDRCGGIFVEHGVLAARVEAERPREAPPKAAHPEVQYRAGNKADLAYVRCPECNELMTRMNFGKHSGVLLDVCRVHGTWFDRGELDAVVAFVRAGGIEGEDETKAPANDAESRAAQAMLAVHLAYQERHVEEEQKELVHHLRTGTRSWGHLANRRARRRD